MSDALADVHQRLATASSPGRVFAEQPASTKRELFFTLPDALRTTVISDLDLGELQTFVRRLDPDESTDVLEYADPETREAVLDRLSEDRREKLEFLLSFDPDSAAGLMDLDYVTIDAGRELRDVTRRVRRFEERTGRMPTILVTEEEAILGEVPGASLALAETAGDSLETYLTDVADIRYDRPDDEVLEVFRANRDRTVAVLDADDSILGVIHADDLLTVLEEQAGETLYEFTGVGEEESVLDGPLTKVRSRYKWLIVNLGTAFLAAGVVGLFEATIASIAVLAAYMPVVAGMGGNAGTQTMAVTVRGISLGQVSLATGRRVVVNEVVAGTANGVITGALVAVIATAFSVEYGVLLGGVIGVSMVANLLIAGFFGAIIPLVLDRLGHDPATSATIFITTATDVLGFFVFLGLAQIVLL